MRQEGFYEEFHSSLLLQRQYQKLENEGLHIHKEYELLLFMSGGASIRIGSRMYQTRPGICFDQQPGIPQDRGRGGSGLQPVCADV